MFSPTSYNMSGNYKEIIASKKMFLKIFAFQCSEILLQSDQGLFLTSAKALALWDSNLRFASEQVKHPASAKSVAQNRQSFHPHPTGLMHTANPQSISFKYRTLM